MDYDTRALPGSRILLFRGNADSLSKATRAEKVIGTGDQKLRVYAYDHGTAGNSKTVAVLVSGTNTAFSYTVSSSALSITAATDGSGDATTTVEEAIAELYADATFRLHWGADTSDGDGSGVLVAQSSTSLTGGTAGETYTKVARVRDFNGPSLSRNQVDTTDFDSDGIRQFITTLVDAGNLSFGLHFNPSRSNHRTMKNDCMSGDVLNWRVIFPDWRRTQLDVEGFVQSFNITGQNEQAIMANTTIKVSGEPLWDLD